MASALYFTGGDVVVAILASLVLLELLAFLVLLASFIGNRAKVAKIAKEPR
jgi:hypothetical protein